MRIYINKLCIALLILCLNPDGYAQVPSWSWVRNSLAGSSNSSGVQTDAAGNIYSIGAGGYMNFENNYFLSGGMFIVKYNPQGGIIWAKNLGKAHPADFVTDAAGNSYVTGRFSAVDTLVLGDSTFICQGSVDMFIAKIDSAGNVIWARRAGAANYHLDFGTPEDEGRTIGIDAAGNCYVSGIVTIKDTAPVTFDTVTVHYQGPGLPGERRPTNFLAKYSANGEIQWVKTEGWFNNGAIRDMAVSPQGDIYSIRMFSGSFTIGGDTLVSNGANDVCYTKYDSDGNVIWAKSFGGTGNNYGDAIAVNSLGEIFLVGSFDDTLQLGGTTLIGNPDKARLSLAKCDTNGNVLWASQTMGTGSALEPRLAVDNVGSSYIACLISGSVLVPGKGHFVGSNLDPLVIKWDSSGVPVWGIQAYGSGIDWVNGISLSPDYSACYISGSFEQDLTFGNQTLNAGANEAFYLAKIANSPTGISSGLSETPWSVYPNPASRQLHLNLPLAAQPAKAILTDVRGQEVYSASLSSGTEVTLDLPVLSSGVYVLTLQTEKEVLRKKVVIR